MVIIDSVVNTKSPPKDVKTNKNIQMRYKYQQPPDSIFRTEALTPVWNGGRKFQSLFCVILRLLEHVIIFHLYR